MKWPQTSKIVGITGSIGSGKSTVARMLEKLGAYRIDADEIAAQVLKPGSKAALQVKKTFGTLDRQKLAEIVFAQPPARQKLNALTHPVIVKKILKKIQKAPKKVPLIVLDIPLLLERDSQFHVEPTVVVYADPEIQKKRVQQKTGWSLEHIQKRILSQLPLLEKVSEAQFVINNSGMLRETEKQVKTLWPHLL